jgi:hypothetical protein
MGIKIMVLWGLMLCKFGDEYQWVIRMSIYYTTQCHIPKDSYLDTHFCENLKSHEVMDTNCFLALHKASYISNQMKIQEWRPMNESILHNKGFSWVRLYI